VILKGKSSSGKKSVHEHRIPGLRWRRDLQVSNLSAIVSTIILAAFFAISAPGNLFPHYLLILYAATTFSLLYFSKFYSEMHKNTNESEGPRIRLEYLTSSLLLVLACSLNFSTERTASFRYSNFVIANSTIDSHLEKYINVLGRECPAKSNVLIWGWASEYFGYLDWTPTPDFINDANRLLAKGGSSETLIQLKTLLANGIPDCILSASGANYEFTTYSNGPSIIEYDPEFENLILKNYKPVRIPSEAGLLWVKNPA